MEEKSEEKVDLQSINKQHKRYHITDDDVQSLLIRNTINIFVYLQI